MFLQWRAWSAERPLADAHPADVIRPPKPNKRLESLVIGTHGVTHGRGLPSLADFSYYWVVKVRLENLSDGAISVGDFYLVVSRGVEDHVLPHIGREVYGSRNGVPMPEDTLETHVALTPERPVLIGAFRFIDDAPFDPGPVDVSLVIRGTGRFKGAEKRHEMDTWEVG